MLTKVLLVIGCLLLFGVPVALGIFWGKKYSLPFWCFVSGVLVYELFAYSFRQALWNLLLYGGSAASAAIDGSPALYALCYGLISGILEELGRAIGFAVFLKRYRKKETAVAFGIGYIGIEGILTVGMTYLMYVLFIFGYRFSSAEQNAALLGMLEAATPGVALLSLFERAAYALLHLGLTVLVFSGVREKKTKERILPAILLHTIALIPTGLYQKEVLPRWAAEGWLFLIGILCCFLGYRIWQSLKSEV